MDSSTTRQTRSDAAKAARRSRAAADQGGAHAGLADNRPAAQRREQLGELANGGALQRRPAAAGQLDESELVQKKAGAASKSGQAATAENRTGLPDTLKAGVEALSGVDLSPVRVHRNSAKPAQLQALAYAQGNDIHLGPGQEKHLPHEAWHVAQQKQGRVKATTQLKGSTPVNDDPSLEKEADVMGAKALQKKPADDMEPVPGGASSEIVQAVWPFTGPSIASWEFWGYPPQQDGGGGAHGGAGAGHAPAPKPKTRKQILREMAHESAKRNQEARKQERARLQNLPGTLRADVQALDGRLVAASRLLPAPVRNQWPDANEPSVAETILGAAHRSLRGVERFAYVRDADDAQRHVDDAKPKVAAYEVLCAAVQAAGTKAASYYTAYHGDADAPADNAVWPIFSRAALGVDAGNRSAGDINADFNAFIAGIHTLDTRSTADLQHLHDTALLRSQVVATRYFTLGRASIGFMRSMYASPFDAHAGRFGAEWAIVAKDPKLAWLAKDWVFHAHCQGVGDPAIQSYTGFQIVGAAGHIKQISKRMEVGQSITVDPPGVFAAVAAASQARFLELADKPEGRAALRKAK